MCLRGDAKNKIEDQNLSSIKGVAPLNTIQTKMGTLNS